MFLDSSMVEHTAVNRGVVGSSPTRGVNKLEENLDYLICSVNKPYFTDSNVEKEKGIIGQEIRMYQDYPSWEVYMNAIKNMYKNNPITIDIAGSIESISNINKEVL